MIMQIIPESIKIIYEDGDSDIFTTNKLINLSIWGKSSKTETEKEINERIKRIKAGNASQEYQDYRINMLKEMKKRIKRLTAEEYKLLYEAAKPCKPIKQESCPNPK